MPLPQHAEAPPLVLGIAAEDFLRLTMIDVKCRIC